MKNRHRHITPIHIPSSSAFKVNCTSGSIFSLQSLRADILEMGVHFVQNVLNQMLMDLGAPLNFYSIDWLHKFGWRKIRTVNLLPSRSSLDLTEYQLPSFTWHVSHAISWSTPGNIKSYPRSYSFFRQHQHHLSLDCRVRGTTHETFYSGRNHKTANSKCTIWISRTLRRQLPRLNTFRAT